MMIQQWLSFVYQQCASKEDDIPMGISRTPGGQQVMILKGNPSSTKDSGSHNHFQQINDDIKITRLVQKKKREETKSPLSRKVLKLTT